MAGSGNKISILSKSNNNLKLNYVLLFMCQLCVLPFFGGGGGIDESIFKYVFEVCFLKCAFSIAVVAAVLQSTATTTAHTLKYSYNYSTK